MIQPDISKLTLQDCIPDFLEIADKKSPDQGQICPRSRCVNCSKTRFETLPMPRRCLKDIKQAWAETKEHQSSSLIPQPFLFLPCFFAANHCTNRLDHWFSCGHPLWKPKVLSHPWYLLLTFPHRLVRIPLGKISCSVPPVADQPCSVQTTTTQLQDRCEREGVSSTIAIKMREEEAITVTAAAT